MNPWFDQLAERFGTPFYAYDLDQARARAAELFGLFPEAGTNRLMYSFKSNPLPALAADLRDAGCEADLTSTGEIAAAEEAGFDFSKALYGGPGKGAEEIAVALAAGVRQFSIESWQDLKTIGTAAREAGVRVTGLLRVNPNEAPRAQLAMTGVASQFGFEEDEFRDAPSQQLLEFEDSVSFKGIHIYWGTQIGGPEALIACFRAAVVSAESISQSLGFPLRILNLGGGFPWPYAHRGSGPDLSPLKADLAELHANAGAAREAEWWFESGRYLSASAGTLVARVMDVKESKDKTFVVLDTGIHHLGGMTGLGRIQRFRIDFGVPENREGEIRAEVVGQLCTPLDCLAKKAVLPRLEVGDLVSVPNVGAYGLTGSVVAFLSRPAPKEIVYRGEEIVAVHQLRTGHERIT
ncbi:MAG: diaminopimelate decarboxylase [Verrucomicrobiales bacterium]|jgi:diaminopimelate decarboxylase